MYAARTLRRVGQAIRIERSIVRYTVDDLAAMSGMSRSTLSRFERGDRAPRIDQLVMIANALGISPFRLIEDADDRECPLCEQGRASHVLACSTNGLVQRIGMVEKIPAVERGL